MNPFRPTGPLVLVLALFAQCRRSQPEPPTPPPSTAVPAPTTTSARTDAQTQGSAPSVEVPAPAAASEFVEAAQFLPQNALAGWTQSGNVARATSASLSEFINGQAVLYQRYGVRRFARTDYRKPNTRTLVTVELYEFEDPRGAFGLFSFRIADGHDPASQEPQAVAFGGGGVQGTTQLSFWKGRFFVLASVSDESDEADEQLLATAAREYLPRLGAALAQQLTGETTAPTNPLPREGLVFSGAVYHPNNAFGVENLGPGWIGYYANPARARYRLAVFERPDAAGAQRTFTQLRSSGATALPRLGDEAFAANNNTQGELLVARRGNTVFVVADGGAPGLQALDREGRIAALRAALTPR